MPTDSRLIQKYNVPGPRYTSYPTVPYWDGATFSPEGWVERVCAQVAAGEAGHGIGLYIHLPYCESLCTFCGCNKRISKKHSVEGPYVDALLAEWRLYLERIGTRPPLRELHLGGGTPTFFSPANLRRLIEGILSDAERAPGFEFAFEAHPNSTTVEHLETLHDLGFTRLSLGVQDFDPTVQRAIRRIQPFERVAEATRTARAVGYGSISFDLVYGLPFQREQSVCDTVERVVSLAPDRVAFYGYAHVPWIKGVGQRGFDERDIPRDAEKRGLYETGRRLLEEAGYREIGMDHFALEHDALWAAAHSGKLHRNFMGYTPAHTALTLGLGMSAIGDSWDAFAQNEKRVDDYTARVARGELPVFRGHLLDSEDLTLRKHILDLMCRFETRWNADESRVPAVAAGLERLSEMESDGLVAIEQGRVRVVEQGRPFLRNVCMAFDARMLAGEPGARLFSQVI